MHAIRRDIEADAIIQIRQGQDVAAIRSLIEEDDAAPDHDLTVREFITFIKALHTGWKLQVRVLVDA